MVILKSLTEALMHGDPSFIEKLDINMRRISIIFSLGVSAKIGLNGLP
jgi:hypothetical protein